MAEGFGAVTLFIEHLGGSSRRRSTRTAGFRDPGGHSWQIIWEVAQ